MDKLSAEQRHKNMAAIRSKDTKPEMIVRRTCIFINGCFWHGHNVSLTPDPSLTPNPSPKGEGDSKGEGSEYIVNSECCKIPKTNREFWVAKIQRNKERDKEEQRKLAEMGWHCITVWECELKPSKREDTLESLAFTLNHIWLQDHGAKTIPYPQLEEEDVQMPMAAED